MVASIALALSVLSLSSSELKEVVVPQEHKVIMAHKEVQGLKELAVLQEHKVIMEA